ncbi:MAG: hypothetical protein JOZ78_16035 [Chroococcidiopsidaceae cyanobacterium CP_BM_ER_R8_30]|nr:hypothetical protein [Chroococcidiopsidaceae cyanobacterium CP_BM_ER_R8_30]
MMRLSVISCVGMLALTVAGCSGSGSHVSSVTTPSTALEEQQKPVVQPAQPSTKPPVVKQEVAAAPPAAPGLIQSTNPDERAKQVVKGRPDPFALLPGEAVPIPPSPPKFTEHQPQSTQPPRLPVPTQKVASSPVLKPPPLTNGNAGSQFNPHPGNLLPPAPPIAALPPPPQADLAKAILVTGVVQVGNEAEAIVKVPNEATSRYVQVGQRLSNGQVLVKRIEMNQGPNPVVILEQYGIEVAKAIGEEPANSSPQGTPTSAPPSYSPPGTPTSAPPSYPPPPSQLPGWNNRHER